MNLSDVTHTMVDHSNFLIFFESNPKPSLFTHQCFNKKTSRIFVNDFPPKLHDHSMEEYWTVIDGVVDTSQAKASYLTSAPSL